MAHTLNRLFCQLKISANRSISSQSLTQKSLSDVVKISTLQFVQNQNHNGALNGKPIINFTPRGFKLDPNYLSSGIPNISSKIIQCPVITNLEIIEPPKLTHIDDIDNVPTTSLELPTSSANVVEKQAARLIVIRRRKMKKHKLRKLRKRMKFEWAKVRQRRELRKEKLFQAELIAQVKEAEKFDASNYVNEKIRKATEVPLPRFWKGKRLPQFIIRQKLGLDKN